MSEMISTNYNSESDNSKLVPEPSLVTYDKNGNMIIGTYIKYDNIFAKNRKVIEKSFITENEINVTATSFEEFDKNYWRLQCCSVNDGINKCTIIERYINNNNEWFIESVKRDLEKKKKT